MRCIYTGFNFSYVNSFPGRTFRGDLYLSSDGRALTIRGINQQSMPSDRFPPYAVYNEADHTLMFFPENLIATKDYVNDEIATKLKSTMLVDDLVFWRSEDD